MIDDRWGVASRLAMRDRTMFDTEFWLTNHKYIINNTIFLITVKPHPAKLIYLNLHPLEVAFRYRDPQLQVAEKNSYLFNFSTHICKSWCLDTQFIYNNSDLVD